MYGYGGWGGGLSEGREGRCCEVYGVEGVSSRWAISCILWRETGYDWERLWGIGGEGRFPDCDQRGCRFITYEGLMRLRKRFAEASQRNEDTVWRPED